MGDDKLSQARPETQPFPPPSPLPFFRPVGFPGLLTALPEFSHLHLCTGLSSLDQFFLANPKCHNSLF